jgi:SAM-dependent methyltransferase
MSEDLNCCVNPEEPTLDANYWNNQYVANTTGWDLGMPSPPLAALIDGLENKSMRILIPGCGNAYEAQYLLDLGFEKITLIDIAADLVKKLQDKFANNANIRVVLGDFFDHEGGYDLILEQTFFCALPPFMREKYVQKMHTLLSDHGQLAGLLFNREFEKQGPPFGGSENEYKTLFPMFGLEIIEIETAKNSITPRANSEVFFKAKKIQGKFETNHPCCSI